MCQVQLFTLSKTQFEFLVVQAQPFHTRNMIQPEVINPKTGKKGKCLVHLSRKPQGYENLHQFLLINKQHSTEHAF